MARDYTCSPTTPLPLTHLVIMDGGALLMSVLSNTNLQVGDTINCSPLGKSIT